MPQARGFLTLPYILAVTQERIVIESLIGEVRNDGTPAGQKNSRTNHWN